MRFGFGKMKEAQYALAHVKNVEAARSWLLSAQITNAVEKKPHRPTLCKSPLPQKVSERLAYRTLS